MNLSDLVGKTFELYGVDGNCFRVKPIAGEPVWIEAVEDPNDGYRSCLQELRVIHGGAASTGMVTPRFPVAAVTGRVQSEGEYHSDIVELVDSDGHVWLAVGTNNTDDYYPWFVFTYTPKAA